MKSLPLKIKAVLFDFDGTLTRPGALDFAEIRKAVGCPMNQPILEFIESLPTRKQQTDAHAVLDRMEIEAASRSTPNLGAEGLIAFLRSRGALLGILSRNSLASIHRALKNFKTIGASDFDAILSREEPVPPKPSPEGVLLAARLLNVDVGQMMVVGDFIFDIQAGQEAGATTVFLNNPSNIRPAPDQADYTISTLLELKEIISPALPLPPGKLPNDLLKTYLEDFEFEDPSVIVTPGVGEDAAAVDVAHEQVVVLKSDPITLTTDAIGRYAVLINANDIATSGAEPRWFLATLLFPCGSSASEIHRVMMDLYTTCRQNHITLCGGHTEITDAVTRPVIAGLLVGTVEKEKLIDKRNMRESDRILLTKAVAVEGTAIISRQLEGRLRRKGISDVDIESSQNFISLLGIYSEAKIAARTPGVSAMHDVTEGGLATAVEELSVAGGRQIRIDVEQIPIFPQTAAICRALDLDPLGLIGSGSLLICCRESACDKLMADIRAAGIQITCIGTVLGEGRGVLAVSQGRPAAWPSFEADEISRLFSRSTAESTRSSG